MSQTELAIAFLISLSFRGKGKNQEAVVEAYDLARIIHINYLYKELKEIKR